MGTSRRLRSDVSAFGIAEVPAARPRDRQSGVPVGPAISLSAEGKGVVGAPVGVRPASLCDVPFQRMYCSSALELNDWS